MNREEFISELQDSLLGEVSGQEMTESINYYKEYINQQMEDGESEEAVMQSLGSARLIAKSIIDAYQEKESHQQPLYTEEVTYDEDNERIDPVAEERKEEIVTKVKIGLIVAAVFAVIALILAGVFHLLRIFFVPIIVVVLIYFIWNKFND